MTDAEIKKALGCHISNSLKTCKKCPLFNVLHCASKLSGNALNLINRQQADNERLKRLLAEEEAKYEECAKRFYTEAIKEFAERLKEKFNDGADVLCDQSLVHYHIDNLVKEMVGDAQ